MTPQVIVHNVRHPLPEGYTAVYVGRRTSFKPAYGEDFSVLGNPFTLPRYTRDEAVDAYRARLDTLLHTATQAEWEAMLRLTERVMAGEKLALACWCSPARCHAECIRDVLLEAVG